ncbi:MAG: pantoate--beta-alanine ligase [Candidatus Peregrinibacteria bacterium]|nr:pantoate--beta-alanine ligase [Candidatus Peregrinibacteria bacterium]
MSSVYPKIGFVPTMGFLHEGHLSLVRAARRECDRVVVSVFVNPVQFEANEDLGLYPRDEARDLELLRAEGVDEVWFPTVEDVYPEGLDNFERIHPPTYLTDVFCGIDRPNHFSGVATVVKRLFEKVQPTDAYFGQKDYQQTRIVDWLIQAYSPLIRLHVCPTVREPDGLAMSSRNTYLSSEERTLALQLRKALIGLEESFLSGQRSVEDLEQEFKVSLSSPDLELLYAEIRSAKDLKWLNEIQNKVVAAVAVRIGKTRLIDNVLL